MNAHDVLKYGHLWVHRHVDDLSAEQWLAPDVCGVWSVKEIIDHLSSFEILLAEVLLSQVDPGPTPVLDAHNSLDGDSFNAQQVGQRQHLSAQQTLAEYDQAYERVMSILPRIEAEQLRQAGLIPWYGPEYSLEDLIVYQYYGHKREHMAQVAVFLDSVRKKG